MHSSWSHGSLCDVHQESRERPGVLGVCLHLAAGDCRPLFEPSVPITLTDRKGATEIGTGEEAASPNSWRQQKPLLAESRERRRR